MFLQTFEWLIYTITKINHYIIVNKKKASNSAAAAAEL
jgi:hypothetical protein